MNIQNYKQPLPHTHVQTRVHTHTHTHSKVLFHNNIIIIATILDILYQGWLLCNIYWPNAPANSKYHSIMYSVIVTEQTTFFVCLAMQIDNELPAPADKKKHTQTHTHAMQAWSSFKYLPMARSNHVSWSQADNCWPEVRGWHRENAVVNHWGPPEEYQETTSNHC